MAGVNGIDRIEIECLSKSNNTSTATVQFYRLQNLYPKTNSVEFSQS
jgi:hypothetical protein